MSRARGRSRRAEIGEAAASVLRGCAPLPMSTSDLAAVLHLPPIDQNQYLLYELHRMRKRGQVEMIPIPGYVCRVWAWIP